MAHESLKGTRVRGSDHLVTMATFESVSIEFMLSISHDLALVLPCWLACWNLARVDGEVVSLAYFQFFSSNASCGLQCSFAIIRLAEHGDHS